MTKLHKAKWLKALRSGKYQKGTGALRPTDSTYCCLGVAVAEKLCKPNAMNRKGLVSNHFLPEEVQNVLANLNDTAGWSFKRIATSIEKHVKPTK